MTRYEKDAIQMMLWRIERNELARREEMEKLVDQLRKLAGLPAPNPAPAE